MRLVGGATWLGITEGTGTGYGGFDYQASPNSGGATLVGAINVMGQTVTVYLGGTSGTSSTATVTFSGAPQSKTVCGYENHCTTYWNNGQLDITINGFQDDVTFGEYTTASDMAIAFADGMNNGGPVRAAVSGATVTLTSVLHGSGTDYPMSISASWDSVHFGTAAFHARLSGSTMTGGSN